MIIRMRANDAVFEVNSKTVKNDVIAKIVAFMKPISSQNSITAMTDGNRSLWKPLLPPVPIQVLQKARNALLAVRLLFLSKSFPHSVIPKSLTKR